MWNTEHLPFSPCCRLIAERSKAAATLRNVSTPDAQGFHVKLPLPLPASGDAGEWPPDQALSKQLDWGLPVRECLLSSDCGRCCPRAVHIERKFGLHLLTSCTLHI